MIRQATRRMTLAPQGGGLRGHQAPCGLATCVAALLLCVLPLHVAAAPQAAPAQVVLKRFASVPVDMLTGEWVQREAPDLSLPSRGGPLSVVRNYRSRREADSPFGYGWSWNHGERLEFPGDRVINYVTPDGVVPVYPDLSYTDAYASVCYLAAGWEHGDKATGAPDALAGIENSAHYFGPIAALPPLVAGGWKFIPPEGPSTILQVDLTSIGATAYDHDHPQHGLAVRLSAGGTNQVEWGHRAYDFDYVDITSDRPSWSWQDLDDVRAHLGFARAIQNESLDVAVDTFHLGVTYTRHADGEFKYLPGTDFELIRTNGLYWIRYRNGACLEFSPEGRLLAKRDIHGNRLTFHYDARGVLRHLADGAGQALSLDYVMTTAGEKIAAVQDSCGRTTGYAYEGADLVAVTNVMGAVTRYTYDTSATQPPMAHNLLQRTDPCGASQSCVYYASNSLADHLWKFRDGECSEGVSNEVDFLYLSSVTYSSIPGAGSVQGVVFNASNDVTQVFVREGDWVAEGSDGVNLVASHSATQVWSPATSVWQHLAYAEGGSNGLVAVGQALPSNACLQASGWLFKVPGISNDIVKVTLAVCGSASRPVALSAGGMMATNWASSNTVWVSLDVTGDKSRWSWEDIANLVATVTPPPGTTNRTDLAIDALTVTVCYRHFDPGEDASDSFYGYDVAHHMVSSRSGGAVHTFAYDARGNLVRWTDAMGAVRTYEYEPDGNRPCRTVDPLGRATRLDYDSLGRLIRTRNAAGAVEEWRYDNAGNVTNHLYPDGSEEQVVMDGRRISAVAKVDRRGSLWHYISDSAGNVIRVTDPLGNDWQTAYDAAGRKVRECDPLGGVTLYRYDAAGHGTQTVFAAGTAEESCLVRDYDRCGRIVDEIDGEGGHSRTEYDAYGRLVGESDPLGRWRVVDYDYRDHRVRQIDPDGLAREYEYDDRGNVLRVHDKRGQVSVTGFDRNNRETNSVDRNGNTVQTHYDACGNAVTQRLFMACLAGLCPTGSIPSLTTVLAYDALGQVTQKTMEAAAAWGGAHVWRTAYDAVGNKVLEVDPLGRTTRLGCDPAGNRIHEQVEDGDGRLVARVERAFDAGGHLVREIRGWGRLTVTNSCEYDALGQKVADVDARGNRTRYRYDGQHRVTAVVRADGSTLERGYDSCGRVRLERDLNGALTRLDRDAAGEVLLRTVGADQPDKRSTTYGYDAMGRVVLEVDPLGGRVSRQFDAEGNLVAQTNAQGAVQVWTYDAGNHPETITDESGCITRQSHDGQGHLIARRDRLGHDTAWRYDPYGNLVSVRGALSNEVRWAYDAGGRLVQEVNPRGLVTRYAYDTLGHVTNETVGVGLAESRVTLREYDALGRETTLTSPDGGVEQRLFDEAGNVTQRTNPRGAITRYGYDALDRECWQEDAQGGRTRHEYDAGGHVVRVTDASGAVTRFGFDRYGDRCWVQDPLGALTRFEYDRLGRLTNTVDAMGGSEGIGYDSSGHQTLLRSKLGHVTRYDYDVMGRLTNTLDPAGFGTRRAYDAEGNLIAETDPRGLVTRWSYDALNHVVCVQDPTSNRVDMTYDALGGLLRERFPSGRIVTHALDPFGDEIRRCDGAGTSHSRTTRLRYDRRGRLVRDTDPQGKSVVTAYDLCGNKVSVTDRRGNVTRMDYDALDRLVCTTDALGSRATVDYDPLGRITRAVDRRGGATHHVYDSCGRLTSLVDPMGYTTHKHYDPLGRCIEEVNGRGLISRYSLDAEGHVTRRLLSAEGCEDRVTGYGYDRLGRQASMTDPAGVTTRREYDPDGNVVTVSVYTATGTLLRSHSTIYDARNLPAVQRDERGMDWRTEYDAMGRKSCVIDPLGHATRTAYTLFDEVASTTDPAGYVVRNEWDSAGRKVGTIDPRGYRTFYHYDANGSVAAVVNDDGFPILRAHDGLNRRIEEDRAMPPVSMDLVRRADMNGDGLVNELDMRALEEKLP